VSRRMVTGSRMQGVADLHRCSARGPWGHTGPYGIAAKDVDDIKEPGMVDLQQALLDDGVEREAKTYFQALTEMLNSEEPGF
ncbi:hypothetical protein GW17_00057759, partial [Ensete ventricosum]